MLGRVSQSVYIASPEGMTGKSIVAFGLLEALASRSDRVGVYRPVVRSESTRDYAVDLLISHPAVDQSYEDAIGVDHQLVLSDPDTAHERILARHRELAERYSVLVVLGSDYDDLANPTELAFNAEVAANMGAPVVVVLSGLDRSPDQIGALAAVAVGSSAGITRCRSRSWSTALRSPPSMPCAPRSPRRCPARSSPRSLRTRRSWLPPCSSSRTPWTARS